jgi:predicted Rdx family selenoprotein
VPQLILVRTMKFLALTTALSICALSVAFAGGEALKEAPTVLRLASGKEVKVLAIVKTALHESDEEALVLQYATEIKISETEKLYYEVKEVWAAFQPLVEKAKLHAAVVTANEPTGGMFSISKAVAWVWKQRQDGSWHHPDAGDKALVPK